MVGREIGHKEMSDEIRPMLLLSVHSLWQLLKRLGVHA
jgi:hypothetical protein